MDIRRDTQGDSIVSVNSVISSTCQAHCGANTSLLSGLHHRNVIQYQTKIIQSLQHDQCNSLQLRANRTVHVNSCNKQINATIKQTMQLQRLLENITIGLCKCVGRVFNIQAFMLQQNYMWQCIALKIAEHTYIYRLPSFI